MHCMGCLPCHTRYVIRDYVSPHLVGFANTSKADFKASHLHVMLAITILLAWAMATIMCSALPTARVTANGLPMPNSLASSQPIPPSKDPFYTAPAGYENASPGAILRLRRALGNLSSITGNCSSVHNMLYRTTNSLYQPSWAVTTLFTPVSRSGPTTTLLSYQIPYNSADVDVSPSYSLYDDVQSLAVIAAALGRGWYVNIPDFEGPLASFTLGVQEGHATLDSIRAALDSRLGLDADTNYAMWGYSGGSLASEWAAELQEQYAPELNFAGVALGGLVPNVTSILETITGTIWAGLIPSSLLGLTSQYPEAYQFLLSKLKTSGPYNKTAFLSAKDMSYVQAHAAFSGQNIFNYLEGGIETFKSPILQKIVNTNGMMGYHGVPQMPPFLYKAIHDELAPIKDEDELVQRYCAVGANLLYQRNRIGGHLAEETNGYARAFECLRSVFEGKDYSSLGCVIEDVSVNITPSPL